MKDTQGYVRLFAELKRRRVFRAVAVYGTVAFVIIEAADVIFPAIPLPPWTVSLVVWLALLGFPVAIVLAWALEMTPEGLRRTPKPAPRELTDIIEAPALKRWSAVALALVGMIALLAGAWFVGRQSAPEGIVDPAVVEDPASGPLSASIAVLPFVNMSDDASNEYFSDGISEELLNLLSRIPDLQVAARTSSFSFKGQNLEITEIAGRLNVAHVLEGSVRKDGNEVRITAQLIRADDGFHVWADTWDRTLDDIFAIQDEIAAEMVKQLKITLLGTVPESRQTDPEVYSLFLQAKYFESRRSQQDLEKAVAAFEQALAIDPDYAPAWVGLSIAYGNQSRYGWRNVEQAFALSMEAAEKAVAIDSSMATAWASLAYLKRLQLDWAGAESAIDKALDLEPNNPSVIGTAASLAGNLGQVETAIELFERNVKLNPLSLSSLRALGMRYVDAGRFDEAIEAFNRVIAMNPDYPNIHQDLSLAYLCRGDPESALVELDENPSTSDNGFLRVMILSTLGKEAEAQAMIDKILETSALERPALMAATYAWRGENDLAFEWLEIGFQQDRGTLAYFLGRPWNRGLEADPRYPVFVEKLGLLEAWKTMPRPGDEARQ